MPKICISRIFLTGDLRSGQLLDLPIISQREKSQITHSRIRSGNFIMKWVALGYFSWFMSKFWSMTFIKVIWGRMTSSEITNRFLLIIHEWEELQTREWSHCVRLVKTHRLICNMTYLGQHVTSRDLDLRSNFDMTFKVTSYIFRPAWREKNDGAWIRTLARLVWKLFSKTFLPKKTILAFFDPKPLNRWS